MARELKFRVWSYDCMVCPDYIDREGYAYWRENSIPQRSNEVMQYTGLKDKQGKEIYEGDILKDADVIGDVRFMNGAFCVWFVNVPEGWNNQYFPVFMGLGNSEVIGNIYENPELVKGAEVTYG